MCLFVFGIGTQIGIGALVWVCVWVWVWPRRDKHEFVGERNADGDQPDLAWCLGPQLKLFVGFTSLIVRLN